MRDMCLWDLELYSPRPPPPPPVHKTFETLEPGYNTRMKRNEEIPAFAVPIGS